MITRNDAPVPAFPFTRKIIDDGELSVWDQLDSAWTDITVRRHPYTYEQATTAHFADHCKRESRALLEGVGEK